MMRHRGSVLILVVALLAVLFVTGMGFLSMTSMDRLSTATAERTSRLAVEADSIVATIVSELSRDLWGDDEVGLGNGEDSSRDIPDEPWDFPLSNPENPAGQEPAFGNFDDAWLASNMPETSGTSYVWPHISNVSGQAEFGRSASDAGVNANDLEVDTDLDGIKDARWILSKSGNYRYAVRIIDLNGMLNLNTGGRGFPDDIGSSPYDVCIALANAEKAFNSYGSGDVRLYYDSYSYTFGRGGTFAGDINPRNGCGDYQEQITHSGREDEHPDVNYWQDLDNKFIRTIKGGKYEFAHPMRTIDTLAMMSYGIKPGPAAARMEPSWTETFRRTTYNTNGSVNVLGRVNMPDILASGFDPLKAKPNNWSYRLYFTSYNWTRNLRPNVMPTGGAPAADGVSGWKDWRGILDEYETSKVGRANINGRSGHGKDNPHDRTYTRGLVAAIVLSGAMKDNGGTMTQQEVEQIVVNLVDWRDDDHEISMAAKNPNAEKKKVDTVFNSDTPKIYGNEPTVYFTEIGAMMDQASNRHAYALELFNPYSAAVNIGLMGLFTPASGSNPIIIPANTFVPAGGRYIVRNRDKTPDGKSDWAPGAGITRLTMGFGAGNAPIRLARQAADNSWQPVDEIDQAKVKAVIPTWQTKTPPLQHACRADREWVFMRDKWYKENTETWGAWNVLSTANYNAAYVPNRNGLEASVPIPADAGTHKFDNLGQLHYLMLHGPTLAMSIAAKINAATTADQVKALYLDFTNSNRKLWRMLSHLTNIGRDNNGEDNNGDGEIDDLNEMRIPGLVNINTAPPPVMQFMSWFTCPSEAAWAPPNAWELWGNHQKYKPAATKFTLARDVYDYRKAHADDNGTTVGGFRDGVGELMKVHKEPNVVAIMAMAFPDKVSGYTAAGQRAYSPRNIKRENSFFFKSVSGVAGSAGLADTGDKRYYDLATYNDVHEKHWIFDRVSDIATTRSDTFLAYVLVQEIDVPSGSKFHESNVRVIGQRRLVLILDRSRCNYAPDGPDKDKYREPEIVARSVATW